MDGGPRRRGRRIAWLAGGLLAALVLLAAVVPLILRGRVLSWAVALSTRQLCGRVAIDGGHFSMGLVPDLLLGRPIAVELVGVHLFAPDGGEAAAAERVTARITIARDPWRAVIEDAVASRGRWRLAVGGAPGTGFLDAFRAVPKDGSRAACVPPPVPGQRSRSKSAAAQPPRGPRPGGPGALLAVRDLRLDEIDVDLDFPAWGLMLPRVRTAGSLEVGATNGSPVLFEARDAQSPGGGVLRLGPEGGPGMTRAKFDEVSIPRVALTRERPMDIVLEVRAARTGRSILHGTADFNHVFPDPGRRDRPDPRLDLDARWDDAADAFARLEAAWLSRGGTLDSVGLGGTLIARLSGPFRKLSGSASIDGPRAHVAVTIEDGQRAFLDARSDGLVLGPMLGADLRPALGGTVVGHLRARALIGPRPADLELAILDARLALSRAARDQGPRSVVLHVGAKAPVGRALAVSQRDAFEIAITQASFARGALRIEDLRARWADASARGGLTLTGAMSGAGGPAGPVRIDASLTVDVSSLARLVPPETLAVRLAATARVTGTADHLAARVDFGRATSFTFLGERFRAPPTIKATFDDSRHLALERARFSHDEGGAVIVAGRMDLQGEVAGEVRIVDYPLGQVPQLHGLRLPAALGYGREVPLDEALGGHLDATLKMSGTPGDPSFTGTASLRDVALVGRSLGNGQVTAHARFKSISFEGTMGPLSFTSTIARRGSAIISTGTADIRGLAFGPWIPPPFDHLDLTASGHVQVALSTISPAIVRGTLSAEGSGARVTLDGELVGQSTMGRVRGRVQLAPLRQLWSRWLSSAEGAIEIDVTGHSDLSHLMQGRFNGSFLAAQAVSIRPLGLDLTLGVAQGGRLDLAGQSVSTPGLVLTADGVHLQLRGNATLDAEAPARSPIDLQARGRLDAAVLARHLRLPALASASGTIAFDVNATGEATAPTAKGQARLAGLTLVPTSRGLPTVRLDGVLEADDHALTTRGLVVHAGPAGSLTVGATNAPASVEIQAWRPLAVGRLDVPVTARGLHLGDARSSLEIGRLDLSLRASGSARGTVTVAGDVGIADARFDTGRGAPSKPGRPRAWYESLPPHLALDLTLHGPDDAVSVAVPGPDVRVGFTCRVKATSRGAAIDGRLRGGTLYSRAALALYDWFTPRDVRQCRILKN